MQAIDPFCFLSSFSSSWESEWLGSFLQLIACLGLLGAGAYFLTDTVKKRRIRSALSSEGKIVVADTCSLGNKQFLVVAQYGAEKHLIGVTPSSISHLSRLASGSNDFQQKLDVAQVDEEEEEDV